MQVSPDAWMHLVLFGCSILLLSLSMRAVTRKPTGRYQWLVLAFGFLAAGEATSFIESLLLSGSLILLPYGVHLTHVFDLLMLLSFGLALTRSTDSEIQKFDYRDLE